MECCMYSTGKGALLETYIETSSRIINVYATITAYFRYLMIRHNKCLPSLADPKPIVTLFDNQQFIEQFDVAIVSLLPPKWKGVSHIYYTNWGYTRIHTGRPWIMTY